jgi:hypothetical protein
VMAVRRRVLYGTENDVGRRGRGDRRAVSVGAGDGAGNARRAAGSFVPGGAAAVCLGGGGGVGAARPAAAGGGGVGVRDCGWPR